MQKQTITTLITQIILIALVILLLLGAKGFLMQNTKLDKVSLVNEVTATIGKDIKAVPLPYSFKPLAPRTPVTITAKITPKPDDVLYIKSVYAPARIYTDDTLVYEFGSKESYPNFMIDPATEVYMVKPAQYGKEITLKMEFLSPISRDVLTVHPPMMGSTKAVLKELTKTLSAPFTFSLLQLLCGILLILISLFIVTFEKKGIMFFWLGLFSFSSGVWAFGECNFTGLLIKNPTFLYLLAFMGLFTLAIPILHFAMTSIDFKNPKPIWWTATLLTIAASIAFALQLLGIVSLSKSMYFFHLVVPVALCILTACSIYEYIRYKDIGAKRFVVPIGVLALSSLLEVINYQIRFTYMFASLFQMGILFFIVFTGITGGLYIRDVLALKSKNRELQFEMNLMEFQVEEQKKHNILVAENAEKLKRQRHDLRHQLTVLKELSDMDNEKLQEYISSLIDDIPKSHKVYCENSAVNAIVSHYVTVCEKQGIECSINLTVPKHNEQISDSSLCVIFGNLLENAIEACNRMAEGRKFIRLNSCMQYEILTVTMDNSFDGKFTELNGRFLSRKREDYGIGLSSVKAVAQKASGDVDFHTDGLVFMSSVYVRI